MESVQISAKKCKIAMALAGHHTAALRQRPWVRIPLNYQNFFRVDLQLLKLQLRLRRSHLSGGSRPSDKGRGGGRGPGLQKNFFRPFGPQFGLDPPLHLHLNLLLVLVYVTI